MNNNAFRAKQSAGPEELETRSVSPSHHSLRSAPNFCAMRSILRNAQHPAPRAASCATRSITQEGFSVLMKLRLRFGFFILLVFVLSTTLSIHAQDWVTPGSGLGNARIRLA